MKVKNQSTQTTARPKATKRKMRSLSWMGIMQA
jgi:hypothetical protein